MKTVVLCGGGNAVHVMAADLAANPRYKVRLYCPYSDEAARMSAGIAKAGGIRKDFRGSSVFGKPDMVSKDPAQVIPGADYILIPLPTFTHRPILDAIKPHLAEGQWLGTIPGQGGFDFLAEKILGEELFQKLVVFGLNQLPYQCRIKEYGQSVELIGHKFNVKVGTCPVTKGEEVAGEMSKIFGYVKCHDIGHFMNVTLTPANQLIHPCIMYGLFAEENDGKEFDSPPLFYQNTNAHTAAIMDAQSQEIIAIAKAIDERYGVKLEIPTVADMMREMYADELVDASSTEKIFATNRGYEGLTAPMITLPNGKYAPNFGYRYMTEDIPNGQCVLKGLADLLDVPTPTIDKVLTWAQTKMGKEYIVGTHLMGRDVKETHAPQAYGFTDVEQFLHVSNHRAEE